MLPVLGRTSASDAGVPCGVRVQGGFGAEVCGLETAPAASNFCVPSAVASVGVQGGVESREGVRQRRIWMRVQVGGSSGSSGGGSGGGWVETATAAGQVEAAATQVRGGGAASVRVSVRQSRVLP